MNAFRTGKLSSVALGTRQIQASGMSVAELAAFLEGVIESGVTTIDTADVYDDHAIESLLGVAFRSAAALRERLQVVTKCGLRPQTSHNSTRHYDASRDHVIAQVENSLRALNTDYLDVLLIHRPDPLMDPDALAETFCALKQSGKVRGFGVARFNTFEFELLQSRLPFPLVVNQIPFSLYQLEPLFNGVLTQCQKMRIAPMAAATLGWAAGNTGNNPDDGRWAHLRGVLAKVAERMNVAPEQVELAWIMRHPSQVLPVIETSKLERVRLAAAAACLNLDRTDWFELLQAATGHEVA